MVEPRKLLKVDFLTFHMVKYEGANESRQVTTQVGVERDVVVLVGGVKAVKGSIVSERNVRGKSFSSVGL